CFSSADAYRCVQRPVTPPPGDSAELEHGGGLGELEYAADGPGTLPQEEPMTVGQRPLLRRKQHVKTCAVHELKAAEIDHDAGRAGCLSVSQCGRQLRG